MTGPREPAAAQLSRAVLAALAGGEPVAAAVIVAAAQGDADAPGRRLLVWRDRQQGSLGHPELDAAAAALARDVLDGAPAGVREVESGGTAVCLYFEAFRPPTELIIVGAGHIARPLCTIGAMLGFRVCVMDDRPGFATRERFPEAARVLRADFSQPFAGVEPGAGSALVLVTRGHKYDYDVLLDVLTRPVQPGYIGMVGSRRRTRAAFRELAREGISPARLRSVHAPIGLDIGAQTPAEIAVAIAAEIIRARKGGSAAPLRDRERVAPRLATRTFPPS